MGDVLVCYESLDVRKKMVSNYKLKVIEIEIDKSRL